MIEVTTAESAVNICTCGLHPVFCRCDAGRGSQDRVRTLDFASRYEYSVLVLVGVWILHDWHDVLQLGGFMSR